MAPDPLGRKVRRSLEEAIEASGLRDGMTISFHHHFREGDKSINQLFSSVVSGSKSAEAAITAAGGTVEVLPLPFGHGRPPAAGNALTNR